MVTASSRTKAEKSYVVIWQYKEIRVEINLIVPLGLVLNTKSATMGQKLNHQFYISWLTLSEQNHITKNCTAAVLNTVAYGFVPAAHVAVTLESYILPTKQELQAVQNCFQIKKVESYLATTFTACCKKSAQHRKSGSCWAESCIGEVGSALCVGWTDKLWSSFPPTSSYDSTMVLSLGDNSLQCAMTSTSSITHPFSLGKEWETKTSADKPQNPL